MSRENLEPEVETKFDVPLETDESGFILAVANVFATNGWRLSRTNTEVPLQFQYYDTLELLLYSKGETIRRVSGLPESSGPKGTYRYDFKLGPINDRLERNHWSDQEYTPQEILDKVAEGCSYQLLIPSALANTKHLKMYFERRGTTIESTHDLFKVQDGTPFKELELELKTGSVHDLKEISEQVSTVLGLRRITIQKYNRVIEGMPRYAEAVRKYGG